MKKIIVLAIILNSLNAAANAEAAFKDVPQDHWAADSVYALVKLGITSGYPDGTFRGSKRLTRYEAAGFIYKLVQLKGLNKAQREKIIAELQAELVPLKYEVSQMRSFPKIQTGGEIESRFAAASVLTNKNSSHGPLLNYRLRYFMKHNFSQDSSVKINLDTMDAMFNSASTRSLATKLIDISAITRYEDLVIKAQAGPGTVPHTNDSGLVPSENNQIFIRPKSSLDIGAHWLGWDVNSSYVTRAVSLDGTVGISEFTLHLQRDLGKLPLFGKARFGFRPRYLFDKIDTDAKKDLRLEAAIYFSPTEGMNNKILVGANSFRTDQHGLYLNIETALDDPFKTGTAFEAKFHKVGSRYRENLNKYEFVFLNYFDRLILDGTCDVGIRLTQEMFEDYALEAVIDAALTSDLKYGAAYPGTSLIEEFRLKYNWMNDLNVCLFYRYFEVPSREDQFSTAVSRTSDLCGIKFAYYY